jgi:hypothetical protein
MAGCYLRQRRFVISMNFSSREAWSEPWVIAQVEVLFTLAMARGVESPQGKNQATTSRHMSLL